MASSPTPRPSRRSFLSGSHNRKRKFAEQHKSESTGRAPNKSTQAAVAFLLTNEHKYFKDLIRSCLNATRDLYLRSRVQSNWEEKREFIQDCLHDFFAKYGGATEKEVLAAAERGEFQFIPNFVHSRMLDEIRNRRTQKRQPTVLDSTTHERHSLPLYSMDVEITNSEGDFVHTFSDNVASDSAAHFVQMRNGSNFPGRVIPVWARETAQQRATELEEVLGAAGVTVLLAVLHALEERTDPTQAVAAARNVTGRQARRDVKRLVARVREVLTTTDPNPGPAAAALRDIFGGPSSPWPEPSKFAPDDAWLARDPIKARASGHAEANHVEASEDLESNEGHDPDPDATWMLAFAQNSADLWREISREEFWDPLTVSAERSAQLRQRYSEGIFSTGRPGVFASEKAKRRVRFPGKSRIRNVERGHKRPAQKDWRTDVLFAGSFSSDPGGSLGDEAWTFVAGLPQEVVTSRSGRRNESSEQL